MQAIILAAGMGKRLKNLTQHNTKCMVKVNGITMIERMLRILDTKKLSRIVIVIGYEGEKLIDYISTLSVVTPIIYVNNSIYDKTNNIYSLALASEYLCMEDTLLLESDLIFEERIIDALVEDERPTLALVDRFESWMDGTCMELDDQDSIVNFIPGKYLRFEEKEKYYKTVNIYKFSKHFSKNTYVPFLQAYENAMGDNEYYESVIKLIAMLETKEIRAKRLNGEKWYEIDNIQDLNIAESLFVETDEERLSKIGKRYGGYWRYPHMLDFCYLVNPYYPPVKMIEEIKSNFECLMTQYPSGMDVNSLLATNNFGVEQRHIVVGNGAAELIKSVMQDIEGKVGFISPTFEEYPNRCKNEKVVFQSTKVDFRYDINDLMEFYENKQISAMVLINPDNPTGNYIERQDIFSLIYWCKQRSIKLIVDESFVDFAEMGEKKTLGSLTLIHEEILNMYDDLYIIKSISKSYGVPGFRLGILASSNTAVIARIKKDVAIWNINSFGEFFMQIMEKYNKDYIIALGKIRESRQQLIEELSRLSYLDVFPSQANYVMCELKGKSSKELCCKLLKKDIFIKDLTQKIGNGKQYIRIAVRTQEDNQKLLEEMRKI